MRASPGRESAHTWIMYWLGEMLVLAMLLIDETVFAGSRNFLDGSSTDVNHTRFHNAIFEDLVDIRFPVLEGEVGFPLEIEAIIVYPINGVSRDPDYFTRVDIWAWSPGSGESVETSNNVADPSVWTAAKVSPDRQHWLNTWVWATQRLTLESAIQRALSGQTTGPWRSISMFCPQEAPSWGSEGTLYFGFAPGAWGHFDVVVDAKDGSVHYLSLGASENDAGLPSLSAIINKTDVASVGIS